MPGVTEEDTLKLGPEEVKEGTEDQHQCPPVLGAEKVLDLDSHGPTPGRRREASNISFPVFSLF